MCCTASCCCCFVGWESALKEVEDAWRCCKLSKSHHVSPLKLCASLRFASQELLAKAKAATELPADICSTGTWHLSGDFKAQSRLVSVGCVRSHRMTTRQVTKEMLLIEEPCSITADRGSLKIFQSNSWKRMWTQFLREVSTQHHSKLVPAFSVIFLFYMLLLIICGDFCKRLLWQSHDLKNFYMTTSYSITATLFILSINHAWGHGFTFARLDPKKFPGRRHALPGALPSLLEHGPLPRGPRGVRCAALERCLRPSVGRCLRGAGRRAAPRGLPECQRLGRRHVRGWKPWRPWGAPHSQLLGQRERWILGLKFCCFFLAWTSAVCQEKMQEKMTWLSPPP